MTDLEHSTEGPEPRSRLPLVMAAGGAVLLVIAGIWWLVERAPVPSTTPPEEARVERPAPPVEPDAAPPPSTATVAPSVREPRSRSRPAEKPVPAPVAEPEAPVVAARELIIETDVEGALVFLDRKFLGHAPVKTTEITAGTHQINVSAEGHDGVAHTVDVAESGPTAVTVRLKEVRLNEAVAVVHRHGMGSCQGRLTADLSGFRYTPERGDDGFTVPLNAIEGFEIDYLKKNLRLKRKGGKTWNFESTTGSADPLFVFHRDVEKARAKLSAAK